MSRPLWNQVTARDHRRIVRYPILGLIAGLCKLDARPHQVVSVFLDSHWDDEQERERARLTLKNELGKAFPGRPHADSQAALARDLARAEAYATNVIRQRLDVGASGIAAFYCEPRDLELEILSPTSLPTSVHLGPRPHVGPLLRCVSEHGRTLVAIVETEEAKIIDLEVGGPTFAESIQGDVPPRVQRGGWRQLRIQKHIADHVLHHLRQAALALVGLFDEITTLVGHPPAVVLCGREPMLAAFARELPERLMGSALRVPADPRQGVLLLAEKVRVALKEARASQALTTFAAAKNAAGMGKGGLGPDNVLRLVNEGRVRELVLDPSFRAPATRCTRCDMLAVGDAEVCAFCGAQTLRVALEDELVRRSALCGAGLYLASIDELHAYGVAAVPRY